MKFATIQLNGAQHPVVLDDGRLIDLSELYSDMESLIAAGEDGLNSVRSYLSEVRTGSRDPASVSEADAVFGPCVPRPGKILCVGRNYREHVAEEKAEIPTTPILFSKFWNSLAGHDESILLPSNSSEIDYEAELCVVIGKRAKDVSEGDALDYVYGYCNANDLSARDLQFRTAQWLLGKTCDGFCPIGPYLVTADEIFDPQQLDIQCLVNGKVMQSANTSDMIFSCADIISYASHHMTLEPGDVILTGTPEGTMLGYPADQKAWLNHGDVVTVEVQGLGRLVNPLRRA